LGRLSRRRSAKAFALHEIPSDFRRAQHLRRFLR
jgi:hypothetical protein